ncbi:primosomal protein N' [Vibrio salinus]|uniref:primosomal protein N' n=1 Tax=Vibrio salinus TaxID=2899784 RepID=UPI001E2AAABB|nr:primosomal protein N' [Vibrio salinus]MCE0493924.1 primosomal protein N' [Vibrio salinus]
MRPSIARIALPVPLDRLFDYLIPEHCFPVIGGRVSVSFGRQTLIGIVIELATESELEKNKLKMLNEVIDVAPVWTDSLFSLLKWCSQYYHFPLGDTLSNAMPTALRKGKSADVRPQLFWSLSEQGRNKLMSGMGRAVKQAKVLTMLTSGALPHEAMTEAEISRNVLTTLEDKGWIFSENVVPEIKPWPDNIDNDSDKPRLNEEQAVAIASINSCGGFGCFLLDGVTGSGKTEVYLNAMQSVLQKKQQVLVLVPEIGLTPQTIERFRRRFNVPIEILHSGLNETERLNAWLSARDGHAGIIIGTRSALFTPFHQLGMIIVDEEHDASYKQQDNLRYHARDIAVMRANNEQIPIVLGSATPSFESIQNALSGKYFYLELTKRAGNAKPTKNHILDIKGLYLESGLSAPLIAKMREHLNAGNQVLLFLNRRGYSPALMCHECGWIAECKRCDAYYTFHQYTKELRCHHCGSQRPVIHQCQECGSTQMVTVGVGTEQLENQLTVLFPEYSTIRIDRDNTRKKGSLGSALDEIRQGKHQILIGTQMLAKGHHFPDVTLVAILDVDSALYSSDFRAAERLAQLYIQVSGRAGRASKSGEVILQTHHPEHELLSSLLKHDYRQFAMSALKERKLALLPPFSYLTLFKAESNQSDTAEMFLRQVRQTLEVNPLFDQQCSVMGPVPAPIAKKAGRFRWQLLLQVESRTAMQKLLMSSDYALTLLPLAKRVRWSIDVEPQELS